MVQRGDRSITLIEPTNPKLNEFGEEVPQDPIRHQLYARREDGAGTETERADIPVTVQTVRWHVLKFGIEHITPDWQVVDHIGNTYDIVSITEAPGPAYPARKYLVLHTILYSGRS